MLTAYCLKICFRWSKAFAKVMASVGSGLLQWYVG